MSSISAFFTALPVPPPFALIIFAQSVCLHAGKWRLGGKGERKILATAEM